MFNEPLGRNRSIDKAWRKHKGLQGGSDRAPSSWKRWSRKYHWGLRAEDHDRRLDALAREAFEQELVATRQRHARVLQGAMTVLTLPLRAVLTAIANPQVIERLSAKAASDVTGLLTVMREARVSVAVLPALVAAERLTPGMSTENIELDDKGDSSFGSRIARDPEATEVAIALLDRLAGTHDGTEPASRDLVVADRRPALTLVSHHRRVLCDRLPPRQHFGAGKQRPRARRAGDRHPRRCGPPGAHRDAHVHRSGVSGTVAFDRRPGLADALSALRRGDVLITAKRDRLARDSFISILLEREIARKGARIISAAGEGTDSNDPVAVFTRRILDAVSELERALIAARTRAALAAKRARAERVGSIPLGYRLAADGESLEPHPDEQRVLGLLRSLRAAGCTLRAVADELNKRGHRTRAGGTWCHQYIALQLARPADAVVSFPIE